MALGVAQRQIVEAGHDRPVYVTGIVTVPGERLGSRRYWGGQHGAIAVDSRCRSERGDAAHDCAISIDGQQVGGLGPPRVATRQARASIPMAIRPPAWRWRRPRARPARVTPGGAEDDPRDAVSEPRVDRVHVADAARRGDHWSLPASITVPGRSPSAKTSGEVAVLIFGMPPGAARPAIQDDGLSRGFTCLSRFWSSRTRWGTQGLSTKTRRRCSVRLAVSPGSALSSGLRSGAAYARFT